MHNHACAVEVFDTVFSLLIAGIPVIRIKAVPADPNDSLRKPSLQRGFLRFWGFFAVIFQKIGLELGAFRSFLRS